MFGIKFFKKKPSRKLVRHDDHVSLRNEEVKKFQEYDFSPILFSEEIRGISELNECVSKVNLYCTFVEYDYFLNTVVMTGKCQCFLLYFLQFIEEHKAENYVLDGRRLYVAKIKE